VLVQQFVILDAVTELGYGLVRRGHGGVTGGHVLRCDVTTPTSHRSIRYEDEWTADSSACGLRSAVI